MIKLMLLRHAKTENQSNTGLDFDRKLALKGQRQAKSMATHLSKLDLTDTVVFCSDAKRTVQTFEYLREQNDLTSYIIHHDLYLASRETLFNQLCTQNGDFPILLIGHNDGLSDLASYLTGDYIHLNTCKLLILDVHAEDWSELTQGGCTISGMYRPE
jgi:phosphohistidine phosphatase